MAKITRQEAEAMGFTVDTHVYPWFAYKGPRFKPEQAHQCLTDAEAALAVHLAEVVEAEFGFGGWPCEKDLRHVILQHTGRGVNDLADLAK